MDAAKAFVGLQMGQTDVELYKLCIEAATVGLLCYIGFTDFRTFKVHNLSVAALFALYILYALFARSPYEIFFNIVLAGTIFVVLLWLYQKRVIGGGDVKLLPVICLWVGASCALLFSGLLLVFVGLHVAALKIGWAPSEPTTGGRAIAYAPSLAGALICIIMFGCL